MEFKMLYDDVVYRILQYLRPVDFVAYNGTCRRAALQCAVSHADQEDGIIMNKIVNRYWYHACVWAIAARSPETGEPPSFDSSKNKENWKDIYEALSVVTATVDAPDAAKDAPSVLNLSLGSCSETCWAENLGEVWVKRRLYALIAALAIDMGTDVNVKWSDDQDPDCGARSPLLGACFLAQSDIIKKLVSHPKIKQNIDTIIPDGSDIFDLALHPLIYQPYLQAEEVAELFKWIKQYGRDNDIPGLFNVCLIRDRYGRSLLDFMNDQVTCSKFALEMCKFVAITITILRKQVLLCVNSICHLTRVHLAFEREV